MTPEKIIDLLTPEADRQPRAQRSALPSHAVMVTLSFDLTADTPLPISARGIADNDNDHRGGNARNDSDCPPDLPRFRETRKNARLNTSRSRSLAPVSASVTNSSSPPRKKISWSSQRRYSGKENSSSDVSAFDSADTPLPVSARGIADNDNDRRSGDAHNDSDRLPNLPRLREMVTSSPLSLFSLDVVVTEAKREAGSATAIDNLRDGFLPLGQCRAMTKTTTNNNAAPTELLPSDEDAFKKQRRLRQVSDEPDEDIMPSLPPLHTIPFPGGRCPPFNRAQKEEAELLKAMFKDHVKFPTLQRGSDGNVIVDFHPD